MKKYQDGVLDCWAIGDQSQSEYSADGKVLIKSEEGEERLYDAVVSSRGYDLDIANNPSSLAQSMRTLPRFTVNEEVFADDAEEFARGREDIIARFGEKDSKKMLNKFYPKADGKYYYSTGDYRKRALDENAVVIDSPVREMVDLEDNPILPGFLIPLSGGVVGAIINGTKVFSQKFETRKARTLDSDKVAVTTFRKLQNEELSKDDQTAVRC